MFKDKEKIVIAGKSFEYDVFTFLLSRFKEAFSHASLTIEQAFKECDDLEFEINTSKDSKAYEYYECLSDEEKASIMDTVRQIIVFYGNKYGVFNEKMDGTKEQIDRLYNEYFSYFDEYVLYFIKFDSNGNFDRVATLRNMNDLFLKLPQKRVAFDTAYNMQKDNLDAFDYSMGLEDISATEIVKINNIVNNSNVDKVEGFKKTNNDIFGASFTPVDKKMVPREIQKLLFEYKNGFGEEILDPNEPGISYDEKVNRIYKIFEREAKFHIIFERIHPFNDGNGRTGRILMNYNLLKQGIAPVLITNFMSRDYKKYINDFNVEELTKMLLSSSSQQMTTWVSFAKGGISLKDEIIKPDNSFLAKLTYEDEVETDTNKVIIK